MPDIPGHMPVECGQCGAHYGIDPAGDISGAACDACGGTRFFRSQPSPTQSDGTLRNMVDMDAGGVDRGGNSLGTSTIMGSTLVPHACPFCGSLDGSCPHASLNDPGADIARAHAQGTPGDVLDSGVMMGDDGERPAGKRDNYMHGKVAYPVEPPMLYEHTEMPEGMSAQDYNHTRHKTKCPGCSYSFNQMGESPSPYCSRCQRTELMSSPGTQQVESMRTLNMEPYAPLWDESYVKSAGFLAPLAEEAAPMLGQAAKQLLPKAIGPLMKGIFGGGGGTGQQAGGMAPELPDAPPQMGTLGSVDIPFVLMADYDSPHSVKSVGEQHDDPEDQDQKEFNSGDKDPNLRNPNNEDSGSNGEDGVKDATPGYGLGEQSPALERAEMILPLLLHYFENGGGEGDPLVRALHDALENESPGYLENQDPEGEHHVQIILQQHKQPKGVHAGVNAYPSGLPAAPMPGAGIDPPGMGGGTCPTCGGVLAGDGSCPQCGGKQHPQGGQMPGASAQAQGGASYPPKLTNAQGPVSEEQKQVLHDAIDNMPWVFGDVLNQIQNQKNTPPLVDPSQAQPAPAPMSPMMNAPGAMPTMDPTQPGGGGGQPMQPMAHTAELYGPHTGWPRELPAPRNQNEFHYLSPGESAQGVGELGLGLCPKCKQKSLTPYNGICQQCGFKMPQDSQDVGLGPHDPHGAYTLEPGEVDEGTMPRHWGKTADANNLIPRCPDCGSATTTILDGLDGADDERKGKCHSCGATVSLNDEKVGRVVLTDLVNPALQNAADRTDVHPEGGQDPSMTWQDKNGHPIEEGQTYELYTPGMQEPDHVRVVTKKPDELGLKLVGEVAGVHGDLQTPDFHITPQQMQSSGYEFMPSNDPQSGQEQPLGGMPGLEQIPQSAPTTDEMQNSYPNPGTVSSVLVASEDETADDELCHKCGYSHIVHTAASSTRTMHECYRCGTAWETEDKEFGREANVELGWLYENSIHDDFNVEMERAQSMRNYAGQSRSLASAAAKDDRLQVIKDTLDRNKSQRTAGRHFTPGEQRDLINERGKARNADLLDLSNTHYEMELHHDPHGKANATNAPDEHLLLGL